MSLERARAWAVWEGAALAPFVCGGNARRRVGVCVGVGRGGRVGKRRVAVFYMHAHKPTYKSGEGSPCCALSAQLSRSQQHVAHVRRNAVLTALEVVHHIGRDNKRKEQRHRVATAPQDI